MSAEDTAPVFVLTGASGWFGRTALWEFEQMFGPEALRKQVVPFASCAKLIDFESPYGPVQALPLSQLDQVDDAAGLLHLAFLTRERIVQEGLNAYIRKNQAITAAVAAWIERHPNVPIITTSSGAAAAFDGRECDLVGDPYATLKQAEERLWMQSAAQRMAVVFRVYAATGRFLKDPSLFALGDFIRQAKQGEPIIIRSPRPVIRSYVHAGTLMRLSWLMLSQPLSLGFRLIDAVTDTVSLLELATIISSAWGVVPPSNATKMNLSTDSYSGNPNDFSKSLSAYQLTTPSLYHQIIETAALLPS